MRRRSILLTLCVSGWFVGGSIRTARADAVTDRATAESLSLAGSALMAQGNYQQACEKLDAAADLDVSVRRLLKAAECQEHFGQTASAWISFSRAREMADEVSDSDQKRVAQIGVARLEKQLCKMVITVPAASDIPDLEIRKDGTIISHAVRGLEVAVDPGTHVISASAPGRQKWSTEIGIVRGPSTIAVTIPNLIEERDPQPLAAERASAARVKPILPVEEDIGQSQRTVGYILGGAGLVGFSTGLAFALQATATHRNSSEQCANFACTQQGIDELDRARSQASIGGTLLLLGAATLTGGAIVYLTAPSGKREHPPTALNIAPSLVPGAAGLVAAGRF